MMPVQDMRGLGTHLQLELPKRVVAIREKRDRLVHLEVLRVQDLVETALRLGVQGLHKPKALERERLVLFFTLVNTPDTLANNDLECMLLVKPMAHVAPINAHFERTLSRGQQGPIAGITLDTTHLLLTSFRLQSLGHFERIIAYRFDVQAAINWQKVLERLQAQPRGHQRGPLRFHIQQFQGYWLGEQG